MLLFRKPNRSDGPTKQRLKLDTRMHIGLDCVGVLLMHMDWLSQFVVRHYGSYKSQIRFKEHSIGRAVQLSSQINLNSNNNNNSSNKNSKHNNDNNIISTNNKCMLIACLISAAQIAHGTRVETTNGSSHLQTYSSIHQQ